MWINDRERLVSMDATVEITRNQTAEGASDPSNQDRGHLEKRDHHRSDDIVLSLRESLFPGSGAGTRILSIEESLRGLLMEG